MKTSLMLATLVGLTACGPAAAFPSSLSRVRRAIFDAIPENLQADGTGHDIVGAACRCLEPGDEDCVIDENLSCRRRVDIEREMGQKEMDMTEALGPHHRLKKPIRHNKTRLKNLFKSWIVAKRQARKVQPHHKKRKHHLARRGARRRMRGGRRARGGRRF